eukprot:6754378-Prorocentrum_lima.AAC.1
MTSSLVGSEMCIRDRVDLLPVLACRRPVAVATAMLPMLLFYGLWWWGPVSYTHLTLPTICSV